jgi:hypothetical protein
MQVKSKLKIVGWFTGLLLVVCFTILLSNSRSIHLSQQDRVYLQRFLNDWHIKETQEQVHKSFDNELNFISIIQDSVLANITGEQIPHAYFGNVAYYYQKRQGICYDRAVLLEKMLMLYNFQFRHVYMYFGKQKKPAKTDFFKQNVTSHAALEVKTKKGWMAIGTDANWLGITRALKLFNFLDLRKELRASKGIVQLKKTASSGTAVWKIVGYDYRVIYGVYSRHGDFFTGASDNESKSLFTGRRHFLPDYNFRMLLYNL